MVTYLYVDGESHYIRTQEAVRDVLGKHWTLEEVARRMPSSSAPSNFTGDTRIVAHDKGKFVFDRPQLYYCFDIGYGVSPMVYVNRAVYFTAIAGDDAQVYGLNTFIRSVGFEPVVFKERSQFKCQRDGIYKSESVIEKAKGVDIALATRMLEDARHGNYTTCYLFTSDVDYLPVIEAVRRMGKHVYVFGSGDGLGDASPFRYVPDRFFDIGRPYVEERYKEHLEKFSKPS